MKDNIFSWFSGFTLSSISMINGWVHVETAIEVVVYGFIRNGSVWIGGVVGMLGKWLVQHIRAKFQSILKKKL